jgi:ABC-2 type transport system permease protein
MWHNIWSITKKELRDYFSSSAALLFLGIFLISVYLAFFWVDAFFARNLADVRPLFNWIPILFIFLVSALTMHSWSQERRIGTLELILTSPINPWAYLTGKLFAVLILVLVALLLTVPLPITASYLGELDWGPVFGGYIAAIFLAAAYSAIGLWASSQTENQIVSLILSVAVMGALYVLGSTTMTGLFSYEYAQWLRALATGSRFESITRGVLDLRDVLYYLSIVVFFMLLTRKKLESLRWPSGRNSYAHNYWFRIIATAVVLLITANLGLSFITQARVDLTEGNIYSLSKATDKYLHELEEPLLIRGYFSGSTHPLLAPLVPRISDMLEEYSILGKENIRVEIVDPMRQAEYEEEAGMKYGIKPVAFQTETKYQASVINTYFNILVAHEDQYEVLGYKDLVDLKASAGKHEVDLKNPEYQITRAIRSVVGKANRKVNSFMSLTEPIVLTGYMSSRGRLPQDIKKITEILEQVSEDLRQESGDNFDLLFVNPDEDQLTQEYLKNELQVRPLVAGDNYFWFYFTLTNGKNTVPVLFSDEPDKSAIKRSIFSAYKQLLPDTEKTIALMRPLARPGPAGVSESPGIPKHFSILRNALQQDFNVIDVDLRDGTVPGKVDFLIVLAPRFLQPAQVNAIQVYLNEGGTALISSSSIDVGVSYFTEVYPVRSGLEPWLEKLGVTIGKSLVLDDQHGQYTLPVVRAAGDLRVQETELVNYPYIIDVRGEGLNAGSGITENLGQVYVPWASPITVNYKSNDSLTVTPLLSSSRQSWTSSSQEILPDFEVYPEMGFELQSQNTQAHVLATMIEGSFAENVTHDSPSRLIIVGSSALFTDNFIDQMSTVLRNEYRRPVQLILNLIDWSLEDQDLLSVQRKDSRFTRTLTTLDEQQKTQWEYLNYALGAFGLLLVWLVRVYIAKRSQLRGIKILQPAK